LATIAIAGVLPRKTPINPRVTTIPSFLFKISPLSETRRNLRLLLYKKKGPKTIRNCSKRPSTKGTSVKKGSLSTAKDLSFFRWEVTLISVTSLTRRKLWYAILSMAIFVTSLGIVAPIHSVAAAPILAENFDNNSFNSTVWHTVQLGTGSSIAVVNHRLEITLAPNSFDDPTRSAFGAGLVSGCQLQGSFDMQVGFQLLLWPSFSGVRTGLGSVFQLYGTGAAYSNHYAVERDSFASYNDFPNGESYVTDLLDGVQGLVPANDTSGALRITRTAGTATAYYLSSGNWALLHTGPITTGDVGFGFAIWSHNYAFSHQSVRVSFDNFTLNSGQLSCPNITLSPSSGPVGTRVSVQGSGFPTPQGIPIGIPSVVVKFDDMPLGSTTNNGGSFLFTLDVPEAQAGPHAINVIDYATLTNATASFMVTMNPAALSVSLSVGTVYFPGDTAVINLLVASNGTPVGLSGIQLNLTLTKPDNSRVALNATSIGNGLFKVSYPIPKTALLGTYVVLAGAHVSGVGDGSALASFEVKLSWLSTQAPQIAVVGVASIATLGVALVSWRKGYFRRSAKDPF
jgi:hypothetical protein